MTYVSPLIYLGLKRNLELSDLGEVEKAESSTDNFQRMSRIFKDEAKKKGKEVSLARVYWRTYQTKFILGLFMIILGITAQFLSSVSILILTHPFR